MFCFWSVCFAFFLLLIFLFLSWILILRVLPSNSHSEILSDSDSQSELISLWFCF